MSKESSAEARVVKLELEHEHHGSRLEDIVDRVGQLEEAQVEQTNILTKLNVSVEHLTDVVGSLNASAQSINKIISENDKEIAVTKARFNIVIAILGAIGVAVIAGLVKFFFGS